MYVRKRFRFSPAKHREVSQHRTDTANKLRHIYLNLYGSEWYYGKEETLYDGTKVHFNGNDFIFEMYEKGFINDAQLIRMLQTYSNGK